MSAEFEIMKQVLIKSLNKDIVNADWQTKQLQGGTMGDVKLVTGIIQTADGKSEPFKIVSKSDKQRKEIPFDKRWRREYDLYMSNFSSIFNETLCMPKCYHADLNNGEIKLWLEYIEGVSGKDLTTEMLEHAALELGRFQGRISKQNPLILHDDSLFNECGIGFMKHEYSQWNSETAEYKYIRSSDCEIPDHLCQMLIDLDNNAETILEKIKKLPIVFCHRDFWIENIFYSDGKIFLIDWDFCGWGYLGEDIASLIVDDIIDMEYLDEYYRRFIPAYYKGISEYMDISLINDNYIREMILIKFGCRLVSKYIFPESSDVKNQMIIALQKLFELKIN